MAVVGDLWDEEFDESFWGDLSENPEAQKKSRDYILNHFVPNFIIPGKQIKILEKVIEVFKLMRFFVSKRNFLLLILSIGHGPPFAVKGST